MWLHQDDNFHQCSMWFQFHLIEPITAQKRVFQILPHCIHRRRTPLTLLQWICRWYHADTIRFRLMLGKYWICNNNNNKTNTLPLNIRPICIYSIRVFFCFLSHIDNYIKSLGLMANNVFPSNVWPVGRGHKAPYWPQTSRHALCELYVCRFWGSLQIRTHFSSWLHIHCSEHLMPNRKEIKRKKTKTQTQIRSNFIFITFSIVNYSSIAAFTAFPNVKTNRINTCRRISSK